MNESFVEILRTSGTGQDSRLPDAWASQFPLLLQAFFPEPGKASGTFATPKFSCTLFSEGSKLKVVFGSEMHPRKFWLTLDGPEGVLEQLEIALRSGKGEWRDKKEER